MARIPKLDAAGKFLAADVNAQIDARTKATMRADLPALAKELKIGGGSGGGVYYDATGKAVKYVYVVSATDPGKTRVVDGETVEVWWVQTTPPDPMQSTPIGVTQNVANRSYTVPSDPVATYTIDGVAKPAGTYSIGTTSAKTIQWAAVAKSGYGFKAGAVTSGSLSWDAKAYVSGDVVVSDSFSRADGNVVGSTADAYAGGEPIKWTGDQGQIIGGVLQPATGYDGVSTAYNGWAVLGMPSPLTGIAVEFDMPALPILGGRVELVRADGRFVAFAVANNGSVEVHTDVNGTNQKLFNGVASSAGHRLQLSTVDGLSWTLKNLASGVAATPAVAHPLPTASGITSVRFLMQANKYTGFKVDNVKVAIP